MQKLIDLHDGDKRWEKGAVKVAAVDWLLHLALGRGQERSVDVVVILDKSQAEERYTAATYLTHHGVPVYIDRKHAIAHNKIMVIDGQEVIGGSFNYTEQAERENPENLTVTLGQLY